MRIVLLLVALLAFASPHALAADTILVMGDSLSAGYGIRPEQAWPSVLNQRLTEQKLHYTVVNRSISGETTAGGRSRLAQLLRQEHPAIVILALGANDGLRGLPLAQMQDNLTAMIKASRQAGARILLAGMRLPPNYGPYADDFAQAFAQLARREKVAFLPFLLEPIAASPELFQADALHPVAAAQPRLADHLWPSLRPLLK